MGGAVHGEVGKSATLCGRFRHLYGRCVARARTVLPRASPFCLTRRPLEAAAPHVPGCASMARALQGVRHVVIHIVIAINVVARVVLHWLRECDVAAGWLRRTGHYRS